jgi:AcrR family transcriptional regulator
MAQMGRPRSFDRDAAITEAMHLFWEHGYEATSLTQLKAAIGGGITAPSFYAAFGSKEALFNEVVARYLDTHGKVNASLWDVNLAPRDAIERALRRSALMQSEPGHPKGCLIVLSVANCSPEHTHVQELLATSRNHTRVAIAACIERGLALGALPANTNVRAMATVFDGFLLGLSTLARDGISSATLDDAVTQVMAVWEMAACRNAAP